MSIPADHTVLQNFITYGGFEKIDRDTSTSFVTPLLIALSMTLNVTLSLPVLKLLQTGATKRRGVKSKCYCFKVF